MVREKKNINEYTGRLNKMELLHHDCWATTIYMYIIACNFKSGLKEQNMSTICLNFQLSPLVVAGSALPDMGIF